MYVNNELSLTAKKTGEIIVQTVKGEKCVSKSDPQYVPLFSAWKIAKCSSAVEKADFYTEYPAIKTLIDSLFDEVVETESGATDEEAKADPHKVAEKGLKQLIAFFSEFEFTPNFRFVNSLAWTIAKKNKKEVATFVHNYFALTDSTYTKEVVAKMKSPEWEEIINNIAEVPPTSVVNNRFKVYYGSAGTGKTTLAQSECDGRCVVCNNSMLPADIMEDFVFSNGQPTFQPSALWNCMEKGLPITLDEINLLPFETLRFLQGILDGKKEITYKGNPIHIADGFQVIGTMNLVVNGAVFNLPEPLVDRASEMREFKLTAKQLLSALS